MASVKRDEYTKVLIYQNISVISKGKQLRFENIAAELFNPAGAKWNLPSFSVMLDVTDEKGRTTDVPVEIVPGTISKMTFSDTGEIIFYPLIFLNRDRDVVYNNNVLGTQKSLESGVTIDFFDDFHEGRTLCGEWTKLMRRVYHPRPVFPDLPALPTPSCTGAEGLTTYYSDQKGVTGGGKKGGNGKKNGNGADKKGGNGADKKVVDDRKMNKFLIVLMIAVVISLILILLYFVFRKK